MSKDTKTLGEGYYCFECARFTPKRIVDGGPTEHQGHKLGKYTLISGWTSEEIEESER